jgi:hypothetical protein
VGWQPVDESEDVFGWIEDRGMRRTSHALLVAGRVWLIDPIDGDGTGPIVTGDEWSKDRDATTTTWGGNKVRFRIIGGSFRIVVKGRGINLSLVGRGNVTLDGAGTGDDGSYSVNGGEYLTMPALSFFFPLSSTTP